MVVHGKPAAREEDSLYWSMGQVGWVSGNTFGLPQARNPIRTGQRFEVWRGDDFVGMAEVASANGSRASCRGESIEVKKGDVILSHLWRPDRRLRVALHGTFEPGDAVMTREQLTRALKAYGCEVWDRVMPGIDLVILGANLLSDKWYRRARSDLRFETMRDDDAVRYLVPPK